MDIPPKKPDTAPVCYANFFENRDKDNKCSICPINNECKLQSITKLPKNIQKQNSVTPKPIIDPEIIKNLSTIMKYHIEKEFNDFNQVSQKMVKEYGTKVIPFLRDGWNMAQERLEIERREVKKPKSHTNEEEFKMLVTKKQRVGIVVSAVWAVFTLGLSLQEEDMLIFLFLGHNCGVRLDY